MKRRVIISIAFLASLLCALPLNTLPVQAVSAGDWQAGRIIDDDIFTNKDSMSVGEIQQFLNSKVPACDTSGSQMTTRAKPGGGYYTRAQWGTTQGYPPPYTCLRDFYEVPKTTASAGVPANNYGGGAIPPGAVSAAQLIWDAAQASNISPKVLLTTIQKESYGPLTVDDWPFSYQYTYAMGAHCPDGPNGAQCDANYSGFSIQIRESARLFRYYLDNMSQPWWSYAKPGPRNVLWNVSNSNYVNAQGQTVPCGGSGINIYNNATAALYTYTPYQPNQAVLNNMNGSVPTGTGFDSRCAAYGNRNFWRIFNDWFGVSTLACRQSNNIGSAPAGFNIVYMPQYNALGLTVQNNTGSGCIEFHPWGGGYSSWQTHIASNQPAINPADGFIVPVGNDMVYVKTNTPGNIEMHVWSPNFQKWTAHILSNQPASEVANGRIVAMGNKLLFVKTNTPGNVEVHEWAPGYQAWASHSLTNQPASEVANGTIMARGNNLMFIKTNTPGNIEMHEWAPGYQKWASHALSNQPANQLSSGTIAVRGDRLVFVKTKTPGNIEMHEWDPGYQTWQSHVLTNQPNLPMLTMLP